MFATRDGCSCAVFCTCHSTLHPPTTNITHSCQTQGGSMAQRWLIGGQSVTWPMAWCRKMSGPSDSSLEYLNQEKQWENCQLAEKPSRKAGRAAGMWRGVSLRGWQSGEAGVSGGCAWPEGCEGTQTLSKGQQSCGRETTTPEQLALHHPTPTPPRPLSPRATLRGSLLLPFR